jgi:hypothetical protein
MGMDAVGEAGTGEGKSDEKSSVDVPGAFGFEDGLREKLTLYRDVSADSNV